MSERPDWPEANQRYLMAAVGVAREMLEKLAPPSSPSGGVVSRRDALEEAAAAMPSPSALELLCTKFGLSEFERDLLLLCAGVELDSRFASLCARAQGDPAKLYPTFSLALAALPSAHWSAITPAAPLRRWRMIEVAHGSLMTLSALRIDERILHYLAGVQHLDERLSGLVEPLGDAGELVPSHRALAERVAAAWSRQSAPAALPVIQLCGDDVADQRAVAVAACTGLGLRVGAMKAQSLPTAPGELDGLLRLWRREAILSGSALLLECHDVDANDAARAAALDRVIEGLSSPLLISGAERRRVRHATTLTLDVRRPTTPEQRTLWQQLLSAELAPMNGELDALAAQFDLTPWKVQAASAEAASLPGDDFAKMLWDACRIQARPRLDDLAQRIEPAATWDDLVLPDAQIRLLHDVAVHVRQRTTVYETWGFASKGARGLGISALFAGVSGTGKTMAAEVLANELRLDLYRIDLSAVVSKYIGETEKNLRRVFDAAEEGGAILLFDEADALFGKRSEVKDSHDRYANIEVSYLLQRMEAYRGLAILTTNLKSALDPAFLRRIRFIVQFPFPETEQRAQIWRRIFPKQTPTEDLDTAKLSRLNVAGGNIRNIALSAAFLAAESGETVRMRHILQATQGEYAKLEKSLSDAEVRGWA
jgi:ATPase family protein associated with various cellular activities (AAA)/winged helix domain-containing protein